MISASVFDEELPLYIEATNSGNEAGILRFFGSFNNVPDFMFQVFHPKIIERFPNLETVAFTTRMQRIGFNSFVNCGKLLSINFASNWISEVPARVFRNCSTVTWLQLNNNIISRLDAEAFVGLTNLNQLNLANNRITSISPGTFVNLPVINSIILNFNPIDRVEADTFSIATRNIVFDNCSIAEIHPEAFHNLRQLTILSLNANPLRELPQGKLNTK